MHYNGCNYLSMLGLKLNHVSKRGPRCQMMSFISHSANMPRLVCRTECENHMSTRHVAQKSHLPWWCSNCAKLLKIIMWHRKYYVYVNVTNLALSHVPGDGLTLESSRSTLKWLDQFFSKCDFIFWWWSPYVQYFYMKLVQYNECLVSIVDIDGLVL